MLKIIGALWPWLALLLVFYTMAICAFNPVGAEVWVRALPVLVVNVVTMAGVRFGGPPLKRYLAGKDPQKAPGSPQGIVG